MALTGYNPVIQRVGVALGITPTSSVEFLELHRAPDSSGAPNLAQDIALSWIGPFPLSGAVYFDGLPQTGQIYWYRWRHVFTGYTPGGYTPWVQAIGGAVPDALLVAGRSVSVYPIARVQPMQDGLFAVQAASSDGTQATRAVQIAGAIRTLVQMLTELVPNAEFDIWESSSQPHAWLVDTTAGATCAQDNAAGNVFSGDWALKYSNPDNASNAGWHGVSTNDQNKGAFCIPLRGGLTYRIKIATKASKVSAGEKYRLVFSHNAAETLQSIVGNTYGAVGVWQVDTYVITVPGNADPNSKLYVQANRNADAAATDFWFDSLRLVEDTPSASDLAAAAAAAGTNLIQNPDFEQGVSYWRQTSGGSLDSNTTTPIAGTKDGIVLSVASTTHRVQQCDRASDLSGGQNPGGGNPLYIPVSGSDEVYGSIAFKCNTGAAGTWQFGIEEYDITKTLIQRTYLSSAATVNGTLTLRGGVTLQATTAYIVPILEVVASVGGGGITHHFDTFRLYRVSPPKMRVKAVLNAAQSITNNTPTKLNWNGTDEFDVGSMHDPSGVAQANSEIIAPAAAVGYGAIHLHAQVQFASNAT